MIDILKTFYRKIKYSFFITRQKEDFKFHFKRQKKLIEDYLAKNQIRKLQIGAQSHPIEGWINVDLIPRLHEVVYMDATITFPFQSNSIDYVFTEHMIEHISFEGARFMIAECFRVMKGNARIRISTPDLSFLMDLYGKEKSDLQRRYMDFSTNRYLENQVPSEDVYIINNFFRDWGHQFIHDFKSLSFLLSSAGFVDIKTCHPSKSEDIALQNLERHGKEITPEFNELESIIVEARKP